MSRRPSSCLKWRFCRKIDSNLCIYFCRVIVGAPEDETEQAKAGVEKAGAVYRCQTQMPYRCDQIPFDTSGKQSPKPEVIMVHFVYKQTRGFVYLF